MIHSTIALLWHVAICVTTDVYWTIISSGCWSITAVKHVPTHPSNTHHLVVPILAPTLWVSVHIFILRACHSLIPAAGNIECTLGTDYDDILFADFDILARMPTPASAPAPTSAPDGGSNLIEEERDEDDARTFFPESWIWAIQKTE